jgi:hypothetical protein
MSTSPDLVQTLSHWLAGHVEIDEVERALQEPGDLGPESLNLVAELRDKLAAPGWTRPDLQPLVRETIEAIALGE